MKRLQQKIVGILLILGVLLFMLPLTARSGEDVPVLQAKAEAGDAKAQIYLGLIYSTGKGVTQNYEKAAHWYRLAAN